MWTIIMDNGLIIYENNGYMSFSHMDNNIICIMVL